MSRVLLLFGGRSAEHEVSCVSAVSAVDALSTKGHRVTAVGIDRDGGWHLADMTQRPLRAEGPELVLEVPGGTLRTPEGGLRFDVVFPVLHGPYGEDGTVQGLFEIAGMPFVGSGVLGSALGMDKDVAKRLFRQAGIPVAPFEVLRRSDYLDDPGGVMSGVMELLGLPLFVKPAALGSSVGIGRAEDESGLKQAIEDALEHGDKLI
ncbi:MAG: D-alanine--D-alanine ligase A, partial [Acidimicrobiia bacterium]